tara:strand:+ start:15669 stop:16874 length:1206 start_codon:yes stop_codon:yes gene_type:complete
LSRLITLFYWISYFLLTIPSALILIFILILRPLLKIKVTPIMTHRFGHLCLNPAIYIFQKKERSLDLFFPHRLGICNKIIYKFWKKKIQIFPHLILKPLYDLIKILKLEKNFSCSDFPYNDRDINYLIQKNKKLSILSQLEKNECIKVLQKKNLFDRKIICLFVRDDNYLRKYGKKSWYYLSHKNVDLNLFKPSINFLIKKGYTVFRMGAERGKKIKINSKFYFDYANSDIRSELMDIFLSDACYFCIQTGTGGAAAAQILKKPILEINTPAHQMMTYLKNSVLLTKHLYSIKKRKYLSLKELMNYDPYSVIKRTSLDKLGIKVVENSSTEILETVKEIEKRTSNLWKISNVEKKLKIRFSSMFNLNMKNLKENANIRFHGKKIKANMSLYFMKKNKYWLN